MENSLQSGNPPSHRMILSDTVDSRSHSLSILESNLFPLRPTMDSQEGHGGVAHRFGTQSAAFRSADATDRGQTGRRQGQTGRSKATVNRRSDLQNEGKRWQPNASTTTGGSQNALTRQYSVG